MTYQLRTYQQQAVDSTLQHFRKSSDPAVIVLPTGAGKSLVIAELSRLARGKVLCLAHVKELVAQNHAKFSLTGREAGIYSAGLNKKQSDEQVTFASVQSIQPNLEDFHQPISLLVIDECHRVSEQEDSQYVQIIHHLLKLNPAMKVLGLTATPFRLGYGWIYQTHYHGFFRTDKQRFFKHCIYELPLRYMIKQGFLTPPILFDAAVAHYDFSLLPSTSTEDDQGLQLNELIGRHPRVTKAIVEQICELAVNREGVMIFAATVKHAQEIQSYLPDATTGLITGDLSTRDRDHIIEAFKEKQFKFLVNVSVLTTGFDAPHVDMIAILRPTQSVCLFQQIVGRGLRLAPGKKDCLIADYAANGYDLYSPEIGHPRPDRASVPVTIPCPDCGFGNSFWGKKDQEGHIIEHYGRRCHGLLEDSGEPCTYRFRFKRCSNCDQENDIAARVCEHCQKQLIDPDDLLRRALNLSHCKVIRCSGMTPSTKGSALSLVYYDEDGSELSEHFDFRSKKRKQLFNQEFSRRIANASQILEFDSVDQVSPFFPYLPTPDFVIARKQGKFWRVSERLFDYQGTYRKANQL